MELTQWFVRKNAIIDIDVQLTKFYILRLYYEEVGVANWIKHYGMLL